MHVWILQNQFIHSFSFFKEFFIFIHSLIHLGMSGFSQNMSQMEFSQDGMGGSSALMNLRGAGSVQDTGMLSQDSTYQGDRNPNATDGGFLSQL
jgi:hypothetical protein